MKTQLLLYKCSYIALEVLMTGLSYIVSFNSIDEMSSHNSLNETIHLPPCHYYLPNEFKEAFVQTGNDFSILHVNVRSLCKNFDALKELLFITQYKFSMICVTETWLNDTSPFLFDIDNYSLLNVNRKGIKGGGVAIYVNDIYKFKTRKDLN